MSEGLSFLHSGVKMVHGNLCPENIILNKSGAWKIMGFDFSISSNNPSDAEVSVVFDQAGREIHTLICFNLIKHLYVSVLSCFL